MAGVVKHTRGLEHRSGRMKFKPGPKALAVDRRRMALGYQRRQAAPRPLDRQELCR